MTVATVVGAIAAVASWLGPDKQAIAAFFAFLDRFVRQVNATVPGWIGIPGLCVGMLFVAVFCGRLGAEPSTVDDRQVIIGLLAALPAASTSGWVAFRPVVALFSADRFLAACVAGRTVLFVVLGTLGAVAYGIETRDGFTRAGRRRSAVRRRSPGFWWSDRVGHVPACAG